MKFHNFKYFFNIKYSFYNDSRSWFCDLKIRNFWRWRIWFVGTLQSAPKILVWIEAVDRGCRSSRWVPEQNFGGCSKDVGKQLKHKDIYPRISTTTTGRDWWLDESGWERAACRSQLAAAPRGEPCNGPTTLPRTLLVSWESRFPGRCCMSLSLLFGVFFRTCARQRRGVPRCFDVIFKISTIAAAAGRRYRLWLQLSRVSVYLLLYIYYYWSNYNAGRWKK